jgi:hypothetical protein
MSLSDTWVLDRRRPACRGREPDLGSRAELREPVLGCEGRSTSGRNHEARVPTPSTGADRLVRAMKAGNSAGAKGSGQALYLQFNWRQEEAVEYNKIVRDLEALGVRGL